MSSKEILEAAILKLKASSLESYSIIKEEYLKPTEHGTADRIAQEAMRLAQLEGATITLQQYTEQIMHPPPPVDVPEAAARMSISQEELSVRSPTFRKTQAETPKIKKTRKKTKKKDES